MTCRFALAPILFLGLWALWFALPNTRVAARSSWSHVWSPPDVNATPEPLSGNSRDALVGRATTAGDKGKTFEELGRQFPDDAAICAGQLSSSAAQLKLAGTRQPGPASNADLNWSVKLAKVEKPSPQFLRSWFAATSRGAKLEPNNTFWDWMQIMGLLAAHRDKEVWPLLRAAKSKIAFDDHTGDLSVAQIHEQRRQHGPLSPVNELGFAYSSSFSVYAPMRQAARHLSENAFGLRLRDDAQSRKTALEGMRDFVFLSRTMRRESKTLIGSLNGQAIEAIGMWGGGFSPSNTKVGRRPAASPKTLGLYSSDSRSLLFYARLQGRKDIAAQLSSEWTALGVWRAKSRGALLPVGMEGLDGRDFTLAWAGDWFGSRLLAGIPFALGLIGLVSLLLRFVRPLAREREVEVSRAAWMWGAVLGVTSALILASSMLWNALAAWSAMKTPLWNLGFALIYNGSGSNANPYSGAPPGWDLAFPGLLLLVCALWFAASWEARRRDQPSLKARLKRLFAAPDDGLASFDFSPILSLILILAAGFVASFGILAFLIVPSINSDYASIHEYSVWMLAAFAFLLALPALWRVRSWVGRAFALRLAQRFAWAFLLSMSLSWGALCLASAPAHRRFESQLDRHLQVGQFQLARKRLGI